jgi:hypothetical protein
MYRIEWEDAFINLLWAELKLKPEQVKFTWKQYYNQRYTPQQALAHLQQTHYHYPQLGLLPPSIRLAEANGSPTLRSMVQPEAAQ